MAAKVDQNAWRTCALALNSYFLCLQPEGRFEPPRRIRKRAEMLCLKDFQKVLTVAFSQPDRLQARRDKAILLIPGESADRVGEVRTLLTKDLDREKVHIIARTPKGNEDRWNEHRPSAGHANIGTTMTYVHVDEEEVVEGVRARPAMAAMRGQRNCEWEELRISLAKRLALGQISGETRQSHTILGLTIRGKTMDCIYVQHTNTESGNHFMTWLQSRSAGRL